MKKCIKCGAELPDEAAFCSYCGEVCENIKENKSDGQQPEGASETDLLDDKTDLIGDNTDDKTDLLGDNTDLLDEKTDLLDEKADLIGKENKSEDSKAKSNKKTVFLIAIIVLIPVIAFSALGLMYSCVQPTISVEYNDGSGGGEWLAELPVSVEESTLYFEVSVDSLNSMKEIAPLSTAVITGYWEGQKIFLPVCNNSTEYKSIYDCDKITGIYIDKNSHNKAAKVYIGSRGMIFGYWMNNNNSLYTRGIRVGMNKNTLIKNDGKPKAVFYPEDGTQIFWYKINCYNEIYVTLKKNKVIKVEYFKSDNIFDFDPQKEVEENLSNEQTKTETTTSQTTTKPITKKVTTTKPTTTEPTTQAVVRPDQPPEPVRYNVYIDETNELAYNIFEWKQVDGEFDGYEVAYGMSEDPYRGLSEKWFYTERIEDPNVTSHKVDMVYATGSDTDMARIRIFYYEDGEIVYGDWSERILLDYNNKIYL